MTEEGRCGVAVDAHVLCRGSVLSNARRFVLALCFALPALCVSLGCQAETPAGDSRKVALHLVTLLDDPSVDVRRTAVLSLGKIGHADAAPALARALADPDSLVREYGAWALGQIGEDVTDEAAVRLADALDDPRRAVRQAAARALGRVGSRQPALAVLKKGLAAGELDRRRAVVGALMQLDAPGAYQNLVTALADPDPAVRQGALAALGEVADRRALGEFRRHLLHDADAGVRAEAAYRIGKLGGAGDDVAVLEQAAATDAAPAVRVWAAWARAAIAGAGGE